MERIDNVIYIAAIHAAAQVVDKDNAGLMERVDALPVAFNSLIKAVQEHKDAWANEGQDPKSIG